jgi:DNA-directed RNA polymerase specialized sigma24 family protein
MTSGTTQKILSYEAYASTADFERIFAEDMNSLFLLSLLLTVDRDRAEKCFAAAVGECTKGNRVFKGWARSWARRMVIQSAIRLIVRRQRTDTTRNSGSPRDANYVPLELEAEVSAILELALLERFVFVMSVLEGYSEHECSILLGSSRRNVAAARAGALQHLGSLMNSHKKNEADSKDVLDLGRSRPAIEVTIAQYLAMQARNTSLFA